MKVIITGACGFIGSCVVRQIIEETDWDVLSFDSLTYAGHEINLADALNSPRHTLKIADIRDAVAVEKTITEFQPDAIMHLAAESHVDRSIEGPAEFISTNIVGTSILLQQALKYWQTLEGEKKENFRFQHISTDEVYGSLGSEGAFSEKSQYKPNSPYSASKASADHLVRAWHKTFGLPVVTTNCSNNYGPYQFPEKLIPVIILNALKGKPLPVYAKGENIRDWLFVEDHARALRLVMEKGKIGEVYCVGGDSEEMNITVVREICSILDELHPQGKPHDKLITYVDDRPGHDLRYAIDCTKLKNELGWKQQENFKSGLRKTVKWYLDNQKWCEQVKQG